MSGGCLRGIEDDRWLMILKDDVIPLLLRACPSYQSRWEMYCADLVYEPGLLYVDLADFASHLVELLEENNTEEFSAVFEVIEQMHLDGDDFVREVATIGALEGIQNIAGNRGVDPERFVPFLGKVSKRQWKKLNDFWNGKRLRI